MGKTIKLYPGGFVPENYNEVEIIKQDIVCEEPHYFDYSEYNDKLPEDYHDFITFFGEGLFGGYVRIFPPFTIHMIMLGWPYAIQKVSHFKNNKVLSRDNLKEAIIIGDTLDTDQIICFDKNYYIYSWQGDILIFKVGNKLKDVFKWYASGEYWEAANFNTFTPFISRKTASSLYSSLGNFKSEP